MLESIDIKLELGFACV